MLFSSAILVAAGFVARQTIVFWRQTRTRPLRLVPEPSGQWPAQGPSVLASALLGVEERKATALSVIVPTDKTRKEFVRRSHDQLAVMVSTRQISPTVADAFFRLVESEGAGRYIETLENAYLRAFTLQELELLAQLKRLVPKFDTKMRRVLRTHAAAATTHSEHLGKRVAAELREPAAAA